MGRATAQQHNGLKVATANMYSAAQGGVEDGMDSGAMSFSSEELLQVASRALRILLSLGGQPLVHSALRSKVLAADENSEASKCLFELAMLSLVEQQLVVRHGFGGGCTALYSVPAGPATARAEEMAYREFPDDSRFVCSVRSVAARIPCALSRRHGSPRQLAGRTRGVEKARGRSKRPLADDLSQLQKRTRTDSSDSGYTPMSP